MTAKRRQSSGNTRRAAAARLRQLRQQRGLTLLDVVAETGLGLSTLEAAEKAGRITPRTARLVAPLLGVEAFTLLPESVPTLEDEGGEAA